jgi:cytochrome P460
MSSNSVLGSALGLIVRIGKGARPKRIGLFLTTIAALAVVVVSILPGTGQADQEATSIFVKEIPPGYRDWKVVSVAHEAGDLNDIRAILGNDIAIKAYREGKLPFPEGAIIGRIAWSYVSSEENNKTFGHDQSFVAGSPTDAYLQFMVKDSKKYVATGGWGYSSFGKDGKSTAVADMQSCFPATRRSKSATLFLLATHRETNSPHKWRFGRSRREEGWRKGNSIADQSRRHAAGAREGC